MYIYIYIHIYIYIYIHTCMRTYMKSAFSKHYKRWSKNRVCNPNAKLGDHAFHKSSSQLCTYISSYTCVKSYTFFKTQPRNLAWPLQAYFLEWRLSRCAHIRTHIYINMHIYTYIYAHMYICTHIHINMHIYTHIYMVIYTRTCKYIYTCMYIGKRALHIYIYI